MVINGLRISSRGIAVIVFGKPVVDWVAMQLKSRFVDATGIGMERSGKLVAGVVYSDFNRANVNMHVAAIGNHWMTRYYLWMCFDYPFNQLKVKRITGLVEATNKDVIAFDEHLGFKYEARLKDACVSGDMLIYVMRREFCKWLSIRRHEPIKIAA